MEPARDAPRGERMSLAEAVERRERWRSAGSAVVLTNGCFDLLHVGHVRFLAAARALGDVLVVALNDDDSTRAIKGRDRPVVPLSARAEVLCALRSVDAVVPFGGRTAEAVVAALRPDVYAKGGDYDGVGRRPPEAGIAESLGARVVFVPFVPGRSTSELIERIRVSEP